MYTRAKIVDSLGITDIFSLREFPFEVVIDLRSCVHGEPVAVEESVLKQLNFHMISYEQRPAPVFAGCSGEQLAEHIIGFGVDVLVVSDDVDATAMFLESFGIRTHGAHKTARKSEPAAAESTWTVPAFGVFSAAY